MALATRELKVTYGGYIISSATGRELTDIIISTRRFEETSIEIVWDISKSSEAAFATEIDTTEEAFRKPFQNLKIEQGSSTLYDFNQSDNTGLDAEPEITKREDNATGRSRRYAARITVGLPANTGAELNSGLREHTVEVNYDSARIRGVNITGTFTAVNGNNAREQYEAQISSLESSVFTSLGIEAANRELVEEPEVNQSYNIKTVAFRRVWKELIFDQAGGSKDNASLVNQRLQINRKKEAPGDTRGLSARLATLTVEYDCDVDSTASTNLKTLYENTVRAFIVQKTKDFLGGGTVAIISDTPRIDPDTNHIHTSMVLMGTTGGTLLRRLIEIEDELQPGWVLVPAWTGDSLSKYRYQGPAVRRRTITDTFTFHGTLFKVPGEVFDAGVGILNSGFGANAGLGDVVGGAPFGLKSVHVSSRPKFIHKRMGLSGSAKIDTTDVVKRDIFEFYRAMDQPIVGTTQAGGGGIVLPAGT